MDLKELKQKVQGELFDSQDRFSAGSDDYNDGYERALRLVLRWIDE